MANPLKLLWQWYLNLNPIQLAIAFVLTFILANFLLVIWVTWIIAIAAQNGTLNNSYTDSIQIIGVQYVFLSPSLLTLVRLISRCKLFLVKILLAILLFYFIYAIHSGQLPFSLFLFIVPAIVNCLLFDLCIRG